MSFQILVTDHVQILVFLFKRKQNNITVKDRQCSSSRLSVATQVLNTFMMQLGLCIQSVKQWQVPVDLHVDGTKPDLIVMYWYLCGIKSQSQEGGGMSLTCQVGEICHEMRQYGDIWRDMSISVWYYGSAQCIIVSFMVVKYVIP